MSEDSELFQSKLTGTYAGNRLSAVFCLKFLQFVSHIVESLLPGNFLHRTVCLSDLGKRIRFHGRLLLGQRNSLDAAKTVVDRIARSRNGLHDSVVFHVKV